MHTLFLGTALKLACDAAIQSTLEQLAPSSPCSLPIIEVCFERNFSFNSRFDNGVMAPGFEGSGSYVSHFI